MNRFTCRTPAAKRADKGLLRRYLLKVSGLSRAQAARCITQFTDGGGIKDRRRPPAVPFVRHYTVEDIRLLAEIDALHGTLSGTTTRKLCERAFRVHGEALLSGWRAFPTATCTKTYASIRLTCPNADHSTRPVRPGSISASGANPLPELSPPLSLSN